jgi:hypothetical protein
MFRWGGVGGNSGILKLRLAFIIGYESYGWDMWSNGKGETKVKQILNKPNFF